MTRIAKRNTIIRGKHNSKKFRNCLDMMGMASWLSTFKAFAVIAFKNISSPILHSLRRSYISCNKSNTTLPKIVVLSPTVNGISLVPTSHRTILSSISDTWANLKSLITSRTYKTNLMTAIIVMALGRTKYSPVVSRWSYTKLLVAMKAGFPSAINLVSIEAISRTILSFMSLRWFNLEFFPTSRASNDVRWFTHIKNTITINTFSQAKLDEIGEHYVRKDMSIPSQANLQVGRCRDYWRGSAPLITSLERPALYNTGEDIVQSSEKSEINSTETESTITINTFYYTAIALEDVVKPMVAVNVLEKYRPGLSYGLALQEDDDLAALVDDGTITQTVGTLATELTYDNLIRSDQYLNDANVPQEGRWIGISPAQKAGFLKDDHFVHRDYTDLRNGLIGSWMGTYPIFVSTNIDGSNAAGHDNFMCHKECIAHVAQIKPYVRAWWDGDYQCVKMSALTTYGNTIRRADHGVWMKGA